MKTQVKYALDGHGGIVRSERPLTEAEIAEIEAVGEIPARPPTIAEQIAALEARIAAMEDWRAGQEPG
jgi:hypothetical protein